MSVETLSIEFFFFFFDEPLSIELSNQVLTTMIENFYDILYIYILKFVDIEDLRYYIEFHLSMCVKKQRN